MDVRDCSSQLAILPSFLITHCYHRRGINTIPSAAARPSSEQRLAEILRPIHNGFFLPPSVDLYHKCHQDILCAASLLSIGKHSLLPFRRQKLNLPP